MSTSAGCRARLAGPEVEGVAVRRILFVLLATCASGCGRKTVPDPVPALTVAEQLDAIEREYSEEQARLFLRVAEKPEDKGDDALKPLEELEERTAGKYLQVVLAHGND